MKPLLLVLTAAPCAPIASASPSLDALRAAGLLPQLTSLKIGQRLVNAGRGKEPSFTDATLAIVAKMRGLEELMLQEARLTCAGLAQLQALPKLKMLKVSLVATATADIEKLRAARPGVKIEWKPITPEEEQATLVKKLKL